MNKTFFILLATALLSQQSCVTSNSTNFEQGIMGTVVWVEGNRMPGPDRPRDDGKPISRKILIYPLLSLSQLERTGSLFLKPSMKPVAEVQANVNGKFEVHLAPGSYSLFTEEEGGIFANSFDSDSHVSPVKVESKKFTSVQLIINYKASY